MRQFRFSIFGMMIVVGLVAAIIAAMRWLAHPDNSSSFAADLGMVVLPALTILAVPLLWTVRQLVRSGESGAFAVGFQAFGWPATLLLAAFYLKTTGGSNGGWFSTYVEFASNHLLALLHAAGVVDWIKAHPGSWANYAIYASVASIVLGGPLLIVPLLGGLVFRRFGIRLIRQSRFQDTSPHPESEQSQTDLRDT